MTTIIKDSKTWIESVPVEYAINCVEQCQEDTQNRILKFSFVQPTSRIVGTGFVQMHGIVSIPMETEGIVIVKNNLGEIPKVYLRNQKKLTYAGTLGLCGKPHFRHKNAPEFSAIYHYSATGIYRQKYDKNAPSWLKEMAIEKNASVAYFEF